MPTRTGRTEKLDLRITLDAKMTLRAAAAATQRSVSEFVLESALARADEALADRREFVLRSEATDDTGCQKDAASGGGGDATFSERIRSRKCAGPRRRGAGGPPGIRSQRSSVESIHRCARCASAPPASIEAAAECTWIL